METIERSTLALHLLRADAKYNSMIVTRAAIHITTSFERGIDAKLSKMVNERTDREYLGMLEQALRLPGAAIGKPFFCQGMYLRSSDSFPPRTVPRWSLNRG